MQKQALTSVPELNVHRHVGCCNKYLKLRFTFPELGPPFKVLVISWRKRKVGVVQSITNRFTCGCI